MGDITDTKRQETSQFIKDAMAADEKIDALKQQMNEALKSRSDALDEVQKRGVKRFLWQGTQLTIFRKGEGFWSLRGKKQEEKDVFSID